MIGAIATGIGALSGLLGGGGPDEITQRNEPWAGVQPYLTNQGGILPWTGPQALNLDWMRYVQNLAEGNEGSWLDTPPPMMMNDPRFTGENVYQPEQPGGILGVDQWGGLRPPGEAPVPTVGGIIPPEDTLPIIEEEAVVPNDVFIGPNRVPGRIWERMQASPSTFWDEWTSMR